MKRRINMSEGQRERYNRRQKRQNKKQLRKVLIILAAAVCVVLGILLGGAYYSGMHFDLELHDAETATVEWEVVIASRGVMGLKKIEIPKGSEVRLTGHWKDEILEDSPITGRDVEIVYKGKNYTVPEEALDFSD